MNNLIKFQMNGLRAVVAINRQGTLNKAASKLCVSPGAISKQVVRIEEQLGHRIFDRTSNGFVPVERCESFLEELSDGFERIDSAISLLNKSKMDELRVTVAPGLAKSWLISRIGSFCEQHECIQLTISSSRDLEDLRVGQYDCAIRYGTGQWPGMNVSPLLELELFPVCAPDVAASLTCIEDLIHVPIISEQNEQARWSHWLKAIDCQDLCLKQGPVLSSPDLCLEAAVSGIGVALVWQTMAIDALDAGDLVVPLPYTLKTDQSYWLIESGSGSSSDAMCLFRRWLEPEFRITQNLFDTITSQV